MEKEIQNLEQPKLNQNSQCEEILQNNKREEIDLTGSELGKFKNAEALLYAYNNLQSDYTKKCQALSALQKLSDSEKPEEKKARREEQAKDFFETNQEAKDFSTELFQMVSDDKEVALNDNPFDAAWAKFVRENFKAPKNLIKDEKFLQDYVFNNDLIKTKIIKDYFENINFSSSPTLISVQKGSKSLLAPQNRPKTLKEATDLVKDMFD